MLSKIGILNLQGCKCNLNDVNIFNKQLDRLDLKLFDKKQLFLWLLQDSQENK